MGEPKTWPCLYACRPRRRAIFRLIFLRKALPWMAVSQCRRRFFIQNILQTDIVWCRLRQRNVFLLIILWVETREGKCCTVTSLTINRLTVSTVTRYIWSVQRWVLFHIDLDTGAWVGDDVELHWYWPVCMNKFSSLMYVAACGHAIVRRHKQQRKHVTQVL